MRIPGQRVLPLLVLLLCAISGARAFFGDSSFESDVVEVLMQVHEEEAAKAEYDIAEDAIDEEEPDHRSLMTAEQREQWKQKQAERRAQQQAQFQQLQAQQQAQFQQLQAQQQAQIKAQQEQFQQAQRQQLRGAAAMQAPASPEAPSVKCVWPLYITAKTYNLALPDMNAVYQAMVLDGITSSNVIHIRAQFPKVRYFSYQTYEPDQGRPLGSLADYKIVPENSMYVNPFNRRPPASQPAPSSASQAWYSIYVTPSGKMGFPNELAATNSSAAAAACDTTPCKAVIFFRLYIGELDYDPYDHRADMSLVRWGNVLPPAVTRETYDSARLGAAMGLGTGVPTPTLLTPLVQCPPGTQNLVTKKLYDTQKGKMLARNAFNGSKVDNLNENFILYTGRKYFTPYPNQDSQYLFSPANPSLVSPYVLFAEISGRLPVTPGSLTTPPYIGEPRSYDVRFVSISSMNPGAFQPTLDGIMDKEMEAFYASSGFKDRRFRIVAGADPGLAARCGVYDSSRHMWLSTQPQNKDKVLLKSMKDAPNLLAFVYRQVLSKEEVTGMPDRSVNMARKVCEGMPGTAACFSKDIYKRVMGETYPNVTFYACDPATGKRVDMATAMGGGKPATLTKRAMQAAAAEAAGTPAAGEEEEEEDDCDEEEACECTDKEVEEETCPCCWAMCDESDECTCTDKEVEEDECDCCWADCEGDECDEDEEETPGAAAAPAAAPAARRRKLKSRRAAVARSKQAKKQARARAQPAGVDVRADGWFEK